jgi:DNA-binding response OmpR family regulator
MGCVMGRNPQVKILVVEDDVDLAEMLCAFFTAQGFTMLSTAWGEQALKIAADERPDLILLDVNLLDFDGFEVCDRLRKLHTTRHIPVIFLTEMRDRADRIYGLKLGGTDYITKPFDVQELSLRVRNTLQRAEAGMQGNTVTHLPEGEAVVQALHRLANDSPVDHGVLVIALHGLEVFRETYGFVASDQVLYVIAMTLNTAVMEIGSDQGACGHLSDNTFVLSVPVDLLDALYRRIVSRLNGLLEYFYSRDDRGPGAYTRERLELSMGAIVLQQGAFDSGQALKQALLELHPVTVIQ